MPLIGFLHSVVEGKNLSRDDAKRAMSAMLEGAASSVQIAAFLAALRMKGETADELAGFALAMRAAAGTAETDADAEPLLDTCGTGGDGLSTFNISTIAAFVAAGAGVRVAKHGNRSISGRCGSADVLELLGIPVSLSTHDALRAVREVGIGFLFAPAFHPAMRHVQPVRRELKMRTVFNLLGPLTNPAGATAQLAGAFSERAAELIAGALAQLGLRRGFVVHGSDGLDEITTTGPTTVFAIQEGSIERQVYLPEDFGVPRAQPEDLTGGEPERNCSIAREILDGSQGPSRDIVLVNAAMALLGAGVAHDLGEAMHKSRDSIDSGAARGKVEALARFARDVNL
ncbi:MAG: anthranilate phosphoribosyltransferase [Acidobacteriota bacterium]|nr:anthranilate phosphoribosyltransferase [Acidobacteriota bacterium]